MIEFTPDVSAAAPEAATATPDVSAAAPEDGNSYAQCGSGCA